MATITLPDASGLVAALSGKKTYVTMIVGMAAVAANHYGVLPFDIGLPPSDWMSDEFKLFSGVVFRSALAK